MCDNVKLDKYHIASRIMMMTNIVSLLPDKSLVQTTKMRAARSTESSAATASTTLCSLAKVVLLASSWTLSNDAGSEKLRESLVEVPKIDNNIMMENL